MKRLVLVLLLVAAPAAALDPYYVNPDGTHARVFNKLVLEGSAVRACMQVTILADMPTDPEPGELWFEDDGASVQRGCFQGLAGGTYCWTATVVAP